jgi:hypothetical protein
LAILASLTATSALEMRPSRAQLMQLASHVVRGQTMPKIGVVGGRDGSVSLIKNKPRMCCCRSEYATLCGALAAAQFGLGGRGFISLPHPGWRPGVIGLIRTSRPPSYCGVHPARGARSTRPYCTLSHMHHGHDWFGTCSHRTDTALPNSGRFDMPLKSRVVTRGGPDAGHLC